MEHIIKTFTHFTLRTYAFIAIAAIISFITVMLCIEYAFFKQEAHKMITVRQEYQTHLVAMHKIIEEYNKTKERIEQLEGLVDPQKKKFDNIDKQNFPSGTKVFSSDEVLNKDSFIVINRDLKYLKQASLKYLKEHKLDTSLQAQHMDIWQGYTDQLTKRQQQKSQQSRSRPRRSGRKSRRSSRAAMPTYDEQTLKNYSDISLNWPIKRSEFWLSSFFGPRRKPNGKIGFHYGIDMAAVRGTHVHPACQGVVVEARFAPGYGKMVVVAHDNKYKTRYAHLDSIHVRVGQKVMRTTLLGKVGATGNVRSKHGRGGGSHLHFEVDVYGKRVNPMYFFA